jgi:hypothetical protein
MSESIDQAKEAIEKAETWEERRVAVLIILAVALALSGMARNSAQNTTWRTTSRHPTTGTSIR